MPAAWVAAAAAVVGAVSSMDSGGGGSGGGGQASQTSNAAAAQAAQVGREQWDYYKANYQPLETKLIGQADAAGSKEEFARARGAANADVTAGFDQARKQTKSRMESYGINPGSPAYQSTLASTDIAEGATKAGALTAADNNTRNLAYSKALDVVGLGRNIPAQSAASAANAANAATGASRNAFARNQASMQNTGYAINSVGNAARQWFNSPTRSSNTNTSVDQFGNDNGTYASSTFQGGNTNEGFDGGSLVYNGGDYSAAKGGKVTRYGIGYSDGGVIEAEKTGPGEYDATALKGVLQKRGLNPVVAHAESSKAAARHKGAITPHMRRFADGGGVGRQGLEGQDASNMGELQGPGTETSDSIPAMVDGQQPAALSTGEVVMNAEVPKLSGDEILEALNEYGLKKRGLEPRQSSDVAANDGAQAYADGGDVGDDEPKFQSWYAEHAKKLGLSSDADHPEHHYDWRAAYRAGAKPDESGHWPSVYKKEGHPRMVIDGVNTKTGKPAATPAYARGGRVSRYAYGLGR